MRALQTPIEYAARRENILIVIVRGMSAARLMLVIYKQEKKSRNVVTNPGTRPEGGRHAGSSETVKEWRNEKGYLDQ
jgi:hypothetical protein